MEKQRQTEMAEWKAKGEQCVKEREAVRKKPTAYSAKAKERKLRFTKRRDVLKGCRAA